MPVGYLKYAYFATFLRKLGCDVIAGKLSLNENSGGSAAKPCLVYKHIDILCIFKHTQMLHIIVYLMYIQQKKCMSCLVVIPFKYVNASR